MLTPDLLLLLRKRYPENAFAFFSQVRPGTGMAGPERYADAVALGLWPSRGLDLHGFELKVSRSDWLRELKDPAKAEAVAAFMDYWWVVVPHGDIVKADELPAGWGLLMPKGGRLEAAVKAAHREAAVPTKAFMAGLLRRAASGATVTVAELRRVEMLAKQEARENYQVEVARLKAQIHGAPPDVCADYELLKRRVALFEEASGVEIQHGWNAQGIGEAVNLVINGDFRRWQDRFHLLRRTVRDLAAQLERVELGDDLVLTNPNGRQE